MPPRQNDRAPALLVTVIDDAEAVAALECGADVLDVKDPDRGALGAASIETVRAVAARRDAWRRLTGARPPVSVALGDRPDSPGLPRAAAEAARAGADILKVGLLGMRGAIEAEAWLRPLIAAARGANPSVNVVAAAFADLTSLESLPAALLPVAAARAGANGCLIDTARKDGRSLLQHLDRPALAVVSREARRRGLFIALAGSLQAADLEALLGIGADFIGARGALCRGGRRGPLDARRLIDFRRALQRAGAAAPIPDAPVRAPRRPESAH